jgi:hypothetical protein
MIIRKTTLGILGALAFFCFGADWRFAIMFFIVAWLMPSDITKKII